MKNNKGAAVLLLLNIVTLTGISAQSAGNVSKPTGCGTTRGCFSDCQGTTCSFVVSWTVSGANVTYTLTSTMLSPGTWIAVGFSNDSTMENDDVIGCASDSSGVVKFSARNPRHSRPVPYNDTEVLLTASNTTNGILSCSIQRPINASGTMRVDANTAWTLLFAKGNASIDATRQVSVGYHDTHRYWSSRQARASDFIDSGAIQSETIKVPKPAGCGTTQGCFSDCVASSCGFVVSWTVNGTNAVYTITSSLQTGTTTWVAIGFSNDTIMDTDDVIGCAANSNGSVVGFSGLNPYHRRPVLYTDTQLTVTASGVQDGVLSCTLQRPIAASTNGRVDANTPWTLLFATGSTTFTQTGQPNISYHGGSNRYWSSVQVKVSDSIDASAVKDHTVIPGPTTGIPKPTGCGQTIGCYSICGGDSCGFIVTWTAQGNNAIYTFSTTLEGSSGTWIAIAFSTDSTMGADDVLGCASNASGSIFAFTALNNPYIPPTYYNDVDVRLTSGQVKDNVLSCTIQRPIGGSSNGRKNVSEPWTLLFAKGIASFAQAGQPNIGYHGSTNRYLSSVPVKLSDSIDESTAKDPAVIPGPTTGIPKPTGCGQTIGCYSNCQGDSCGFIVTWTAQGNNAIYTFSTTLEGSSGTWIAIAFSTDNMMGADDVLGCASNAQGSTAAFTALNNLRAPPTFYSDVDVRLTSGQVKDNVLSCTIERPIGGSSNGRKNVSEQWTILFATGTASYASGSLQIQKHQINRFVVDQKVRVEDKVDIGAVSSGADPMIKAHGSLMIVAWIFLASIGIVLARYYKPVWSKTMCSEKVWFQMHRLCMVLVFCATAIGFIIIFAYVKGYSKIVETKEFLVGHPIIGIIVMILTVMNPVMAIFRPHPGTSTRPIFNWAHWFVGTAAHILGVVNIFFGVLLSNSDVPYYLLYILGAYVAWQLFVQLLLELLSFFGRKYERSDAYEMSADDGAKHSASAESSFTIIIKRVILIVHCVVVAGFAAALIGLLATGKAGGLKDM